MPESRKRCSGGLSGLGDLSVSKGGRPSIFGGGSAINQFAVRGPAYLSLFLRLSDHIDPAPLKKYNVPVCFP